MAVKFSRHLLKRMQLRGISEKLIRDVLEGPGELYIDTETEYHVALKHIVYMRRSRDFIVVYEKRGGRYIVGDSPSFKGRSKAREGEKREVEKGMNKEPFRISYDAEADVLYISRKGKEEEFVELAPGVSVELDQKGEVIGFEILRASELLKGVLEPMKKRLQGI